MRQQAVYRCKIDQAFRDLPELGRVRDEYFVGCRSLPVEQHIIFYHLTDDEIVVDRILHSRQDATGKLRP